MSNLWSKSGGIAVRSGSPLLCASCPCGISVNCGNCLAMPNQWTLKINSAGTITNNGCPNCVSILGGGGPWTLNYRPAGETTCGANVSNGCYWNYPDTNVGQTCADLGDICAAGAHCFWELRYLTGITFTWELLLNVASSTVLTFTPIAPASFNCLGVNTFTGPSWLASTCADGGITATLTPV